MKEYYVFITPDNVIWGVGTSKKEAVEDAIKGFESISFDEDNVKPTLGKVIRSTTSLAMEVYKHGWYDNMFDIYFVEDIAFAKIKNNNPIDYYASLENVNVTKLNLKENDKS